MTQNIIRKKSSNKEKERALVSFSEPYRISLPMLLLTLALFAFGLVVLFSASMPTAYTNDLDSFYYVARQVSFSVIGVALSVIIIYVKPIKSYNRLILVVGAYGTALVFLILTRIPALSNLRGGARRWFAIGSFEIQTSEIAKIALVFCIAGYRSFVNKRRKEGGFRYKTKRKQEFMDALFDVMIPGVAISLMLGLIIMQPHMSGFIIIGLVSAICLLASGIKLRSWIDGGITLLLGGLVLANLFMLFSNVQGKDKILGNFEHVGERFAIFQTMNKEESSIEEEEDMEDVDAYQSEQAKIAIGSGGRTGVGFGNSRQKFRYLPEAHNDYVFAIACEELGFVGGASIVFLFWLFMICGLSITLRAQSDFSRIIALGYTSLVSLQAFLNIGVSAGVIPPTGITMPFFSYGGTANMFFMIAVGMILSVSRTGVRRKKRVYI